MDQQRRQLKRSGTKKSHSWWWDSHISPKNSKWLAENLVVMDDNVKRMLKLIEEDADSFAQKAQMYYQKRPQLINLVEEFYRMYRSLAERYDNVTGELRKNVPSDLRSQGSGVSDVSVELSPQEPRRSGPRAAGFDVFLRSAGSNASDVQHKDEDDSSSVTDSRDDSDSDSDDSSSVNNYSSLIENSGDQTLTRRITDLEMELRETKERLLSQQDFGSSCGENFVDVHEKIVEYEKELKEANERIKSSEEEIHRLKIELQTYQSSEITNGIESAESRDRRLELDGEDNGVSNEKYRIIEEELRVAKTKLEDFEEEITCLRKDNNVADEKLRELQDRLELGKRDAAVWKAKLNAEKREVVKLQERMVMMKTSLQDRDNEIRDLKTAVSDAEKKIFPEKAQIKAEMSKLVEERNRVEEQLKELESRGRFLEDELRRVVNEKGETEERLMGEIRQLNEEMKVLRIEKDGLCGKIVLMEKHMEELHMEHVKLISAAERGRKAVEGMRRKLEELEEEVERQRVVIADTAEEKREAIRQLCLTLEHYRNGYVNLRKAVAGHKRVLPVLASRA